MDKNEISAYLSRVTISGDLNDVYILGVKLEEEGVQTKLREGAEDGGYYLLVSECDYPFD